MDQRTIEILFALLASAIRGTKLTTGEKEKYSVEMLPDLVKISAKHDVAHLLVVGLKQNGLLSKENVDCEKYILTAVYRYEQLKYEYDNLCDALEKAQIPFIPLKGAIIRDYYPEAWMRTSCDVDILVHKEDLDAAVAYLTENLQYTEKGRATHDVSLFSTMGVHVELHFDLVEEGRANNAIGVLSSVWENVSLHKDSKYWCEMSDAFFYFYHVAHMAKHFESGGCGIRPFIDMWLLDRVDGVDISARDGMLSDGGLLEFANVSRNLSEVWLNGRPHDDTSLRMQNFLLYGGVYGSTDNRIAIQQKKKGGRLGYILHRIFIPYEKLKRYYPVLEKRRWLTPVMQVRRWFMLLDPDVAKRSKRERAINGNLDKSKADEMNEFLSCIGLD